MRPVLLVLALLLLAPAGAAAQATGPSGPPNPLPPSAVTGDSATGGQTAAAIRGLVTPNGGTTTVHFDYGTSSAYGLTTANQTLPADATATTLSAALSRLTTATSYHYRVVATNDAGETRGGDRTFTTAKAPAKPTVASEPARDVAVDGATLSARVDPNRQATTITFEYGTSTKYGITTAAQDAGSGDSGVRFTARVGGLSPNTTYHFRLRARNATGTTTGGDHSFKTGKQALGLTASISRSIVRYTGPLSVTGTVTGTDKSGVSLVLQRRSSPFTADFATYGSPLKTNSLGVASFLVPPFTLASQFRLVAPSRGNLTSNVTTVEVRPLLKLHVTRLKHGRLRFSGSVAPANATGLVSIQRRGANGHYAPVKRAKIRATRGVGRFSMIVPTRPTASTYRAATRLTSPGLVNAHSAIVRVRAGR